MAIDHKTQNEIRHLLDLLETIGPVYSKRMFSGHGFFLEGLMFAIHARGVFYLKTDAMTATAFETRGLAPFTYQKNGKTYALAYREAPPEVLDNVSAMQEWAGIAIAVAKAAAQTKANKASTVAKRPIRKPS